MTKKFLRVVVFTLFVLFASSIPQLVQAQNSEIDILSERAPRIVVGDFIFNKSGLSGDNFFIGQTVEISKEVDGDIFIIGGNVKIDAPVNGDIRVISESLEVRSQVNGSLAFITSTTYISSTGEIEDDVYGVTEKLIHEGRIGGDLNMRFSLDSDIAVSGKILGNFYYSDSRPNISESAFIEGEIEKVDFSDNSEDNHLQKILGSLYHTFSVILLGLVLYWLAPKLIINTTKELESKPLKYIGIGLLTLFTLPFFLLLISVTLIGIPLALVISLFIMVIAYISPFFAGIWIGKKVFNTKKLNILHAILGVLLFDLISILPILGGLFNLLIFTIILGIVVNKLFSNKIKTTPAK